MKTKLSKTLLKKYNLTAYHFSKLAGVSPSTVARYLDKVSIKEDAKKKIEDTAADLKKFNVKWPDISWGKNVTTAEQRKLNIQKSKALDKKFLKK